jgi:O-antigen ligase
MVPDVSSPASLDHSPRAGRGADRNAAWVCTALAVVTLALAVPAAAVTGASVGQVVFFGSVAVGIAAVALCSPVAAILVLLVTLFLRTAWADTFPTDPLWVAFAVAIVAAALWADRTTTRLRGMTAVEWLMVLYLLWNVYSFFAPHRYTADDQLTNEPVSVPRLIAIGIVIPFVVYAIGRYTFDRRGSVRVLLWAILLFAAYSAAVSILQFTGPTSWVWPRYIIDAPNWPGRAVGVFNQPVANGLVLAIGFGVAMLLAGHRTEPVWRRAVACAVAVGCGYGMFLTHTRAVWLSGVVVLLIGALLAKGARTGYVAALVFTGAVVAANWSAFTSTDRRAGGVASVNEVDDRLNTMQTALWAAREKPFTGWGIGRFPSVNTYHHQQWAPDVPWIRGYAVNSHENELGILAELGIIGVTLWIAVIVLIAYRLYRAYRTMPAGDLCGKPLAVLAIMALAALLCTGVTVDLRFLDFPTAAAFLIFGVTLGWADRHSGDQREALHNDEARVPATHD